MTDSVATPYQEHKALSQITPAQAYTDAFDAIDAAKAEARELKEKLEESFAELAKVKARKPRRSRAKEEPTRKKVAAWPVLLIALPALVAIWSGWVGLGGLTGFGVVHPLPGIWDELSINTAITLPIGVEVYAAYAMRAWLSGSVPARAKRFAKWSAIGSLVVGSLGQVAYHLLVAWGYDAAPWPIVTIVACLPVTVLGLGAALAHLLREDD